jgi:hypothetical protein
MKLELTNEECQAPLGFLEGTLQSPRYPLSPEVEALRRVAQRLHGDNKRKPARS